MVPCGKKDLMGFVETYMSFISYYHFILHCDCTYQMPGRIYRRVRTGAPYIFFVNWYKKEKEKKSVLINNIAKIGTMSPRYQTNWKIIVDILRNAT